MTWSEILQDRRVRVWREGSRARSERKAEGSACVWEIGFQSKLRVVSFLDWQRV